MPRLFPTFNSLYGGSCRRSRDQLVDWNHLLDIPTYGSVVVLVTVTVQVSSTVFGGHLSQFCAPCCQLVTVIVDAEHPPPWESPRTWAAGGVAVAALLEVEFETWLWAPRASPTNTQSPLLQIISLYFLFAMRQNDCVDNSSPTVIRSECERSANFYNKAIECWLEKNGVPDRPSIRSAGSALAEGRINPHGRPMNQSRFESPGSLQVYSKVRQCQVRMNAVFATRPWRSNKEISRT